MNNELQYYVNHHPELDASISIDGPKIAGKKVKVTVNNKGEENA